MKRHRYVLVCSNGTSHDLTRETSFYPFGLTAVMRYDLPALLRKGWQPVRETRMGSVETGGGGHVFSLILLEKDDTGQEPPVAEAVDE